MKYISILFIATIFVFGCNNKIEQINSDTDLKKADSLSRMFYDRVKKKDYLHLIKMFKDKENINQLTNLFKFKDSTLGSIKNISYETAYSKKVIKKDSVIIDYFISTKVILIMEVKLMKT
ncbi:MAG: hypothetical protein ACPGU9_09850 [Flavobacteriaceae bacterium]